MLLVITNHIFFACFAIMFAKQPSVSRITVWVIGGFLSLFLANSALCAHIEVSKVLLGTWKYVGGTKQSATVECPDVMILHSGGKYEILNDCYGDNATLPVVEEGIWSYQHNDNLVILSERDLRTNYSFQEKTDTLTGHIEYISNHEITICFGKKENCTEEIYQKVLQ